MGGRIFVGIRLHWAFRSQSLGPAFELSCLFYLLCPRSLVALGQSHCSVPFTMLSKIPKCSERNSPVRHWLHSEGQTANLRGNSSGFVSVLGVLWKYWRESFAIKWTGGKANTCQKPGGGLPCLFQCWSTLIDKGELYLLPSSWL